jgi:hypothetical protein
MARFGSARLAVIRAARGELTNSGNIQPGCRLTIEATVNL